MLRGCCTTGMKGLVPSTFVVPVDLDEDGAAADHDEVPVLRVVAPASTPGADGASGADLYVVAKTDYVPSDSNKVCVCVCVCRKMKTE